MKLEDAQRIIRDASISYPGHMMASAQAAVIVGWDMTSNTGVSPASINATTVDTNLSTPVQLSYGSGVSPAGPPQNWYPATCGGYQVWGTQNSSAGFAAAVSLNTYYEFTITPTGGSTIQVDSISAPFWGNQNDTATTIYLASSLNSYASSLGSTPLTITGTNKGNWSITLGTPLVSTTPVTMRIYMARNWSYEYAGFAAPTAGADSLIVNGNVTVPEPATWALLAFSLTSIVIFRRRRGGLLHAITP